MESIEYGLILAFFGLVILPAPFLGRYLYRVLERQPLGLSRYWAGFEQRSYQYLGVKAELEQSWRGYTQSLVLFTVVNLGLLWAVLLGQGYLPLNPQQLPGLEWTLAFNTAVSFVTNTNWQAYSGEASLSYFSQMLGLTVQNFISPAVGLAVLAVLCRGLARRTTHTLGNFWVDLLRILLYVLLPACLLFAPLLVALGVPQTLDPYVSAVGLQGQEQSIPLGPVASQLAIKQLGTNGGGFFGVNSAHPFENPSAWSNLLELVAILLIPASLIFTLGDYVRDRRQSWALLVCMLLLFVAGLVLTLYAEHQPSPALSGLAVEQTGSLEGKETRFGVTGSVLWAVATTAASNGSVNAMHDSFSPLGGLVLLANMMLGEVVFGGVGAGLYGMLLCVMIAVFLAGLMIGRTPEYLGKKLEAVEIRWLVASLFIMPVGVLVLVALAVSLDGPSSAITNPGPHGFSQILYAYTSAAANNGSAFAGFSANTPFHNLLLAFAMLLGRFGYILPVLAIAGSLGAKRSAPADSNSRFPTHSPLFVLLLTLSILLVGGLTFLPALALGPLAEHLTALQ